MRFEYQGRSTLLHQMPYLEKIIARFGMQNAKIAYTPLPEGYKPMPNIGTSDPQMRNYFQQIIGSLIYLMIGTRPDIAYAVIKLSQFSANPSKDHVNKALHIIRYLIGTRYYHLKFDGNKAEGLIAHTDSDWATDENPDAKRKSVTGYFFQLASAPVVWTSRQQKTIASSSTEAEYMAMSDASKQLKWIRSMFFELGYNLAPIPVNGDNQGSIFMAQNPITEKRSKHIDIKYHVIREYVKEGHIEIFYIPSDENPADMFTKVLGRVKFEKFRNMLGLEFFSEQPKAYEFSS